MCIFDINDGKSKKQLSNEGLIIQHALRYLKLNEKDQKLLGLNAAYLVIAGLNKNGTNFVSVYI